MGSALHFSLGVCTRAFRADFHRPIYSRICYRSDSWDFQAVKMSRHCLLFFRDCRRQWGKSVSVQLTDEGRSPQIRLPGGTGSSPDRGRRRLGPGQGPAALDRVHPPKAEPPAGRVEGWPSHGPFRRKGIPCYTSFISLRRPSAGLQLLER